MNITFDAVYRLYGEQTLILGVKEVYIHNEGWQLVQLSGTASQQLIEAIRLKAVLVSLIVQTSEFTRITDWKVRDLLAPDEIL